jgi:DNA-binding transcriptional LysR family regulator
MQISRVPDLDALHLLLDIASTGSLGAAGRLRGISQPAVTGRLRSMEALVGFPLVERGPRGSSLTTAGKLVAEWAQPVLSAAVLLQGGIDSLRSDRDSRLRVAASLTCAEHLLPAWLGALARRLPDTTVTLSAMNSAEVAVAVLSEVAELGFVEGPTVPRGLASQTVQRDRLVLVVPPGHALARRRRPVTGAELAATRLISREANSGSRQALEAALAPWLPMAPPLLELSTASAVRAAVSAGAGPAVLSELAVREDLQAGRLVEVPVVGLTLNRSLRTVWIAGRRPNGPARELLGIARAGSR